MAELMDALSSLVESAVRRAVAEAVAPLQKQLVFLQNQLDFQNELILRMSSNATQESETKQLHNGEPSLNIDSESTRMLFEDIVNKLELPLVMKEPKEEIICVGNGAARIDDREPGEELECIRMDTQDEEDEPFDDNVAKKRSKNVKKKCDFCGISVSNLYRHLRLHTGECPYQCTQCPDKFDRKEKLKRHADKVHNGRTSP